MKQSRQGAPDPWMLGEDIPDIDFAFSEIWLSCFANEFVKPSGRAYAKVLSVYRKYHLWFYYGQSDSNAVGENIVNRFVRNPGFATRVNREIVRTADQLRRFAERLPETKLDRLSNQVLADLFREHDRLHTVFYQWGWIPVAADMFHSNLTERLKAELEELGVPADRVNEAFISLTQPTRRSLIQIERESFLALADTITKDQRHRRLFRALYEQFLNQEAAPLGFQTHTREFEMLLEQRVSDLVHQVSPVFRRRIEAHYEKYFFVNRMWVGEVSSFEHYLKELVKLVGTRANPGAMLRAERATLVRTTRQRANNLRRYRISGHWRSLFDAFGDFMVTKIYRRYAQIYALYKIEFLQREVARRFTLSLEQVRFLTPDELQSALRSGVIHRAELKRRTKFCVALFERGRTRVVTGAAAKALAAKINVAKVDGVTELKGQTGCLGTGIGTVKIVIRPSDMTKMKKGDILVSIATDPDIVPAMKKAAAIVTEQGGVTSHAAIVARELGIPCVIGTRIATKVLKDGDRVEVDATKGVVKKI